MNQSIQTKNYKILLALSILLSGISCSYAQNQLDSLENYDPFISITLVRKIITENFSILEPNKKALVSEYREKVREAVEMKRTAEANESYINIGDIYFTSGIYAQSIQAYYHALEGYESYGDSLNAALVKIKLARSYYFADLMPAKDYYSEAYKILKTSDKKNISALSFYVGGMFESDSVKQSKMYQEALRLEYEYIKENPGDKKSKETLASLLNVNHQLKKAIAMAEDAGNGWLQILYLNNYGFELVELKKYDEALQTFLKSLNLCKKIRNKTLLRNTYENIGRVYRLKGNWQKSSLYQQLMHLVEESLYSERFSLQISDYKVKYDVKKREIENAYLKKEQNILSENIAIQTDLNILLIVSTTVISVVMLFIFFGKRNLKTANVVLDQQKNEILLQKEELENLNKELQESETNLKEAQATAKLANWELDVTGTVLSFSDQFSKILDTSDVRIKNSFNDVLNEKIIHEDKAAVVDFFFNTNTNLEESVLEFRTLVNNNIRWMKAHKVVALNKNKEVVRIFGTLQNITEAKEKEAIKIEIAAQHSFTKQLIQSQEEERKRIAGELHDSLGQDILLIKNRVLIGLQNEKMDDSAIAQLDEINQAVSSVLNSVREISFNLRPAHLERLGLTETIASAIKKFSETGSITINSHLENVDNLLEHENEINFFRIVQEGINNITKHSNAKEAFIDIKKETAQIVLTISDNGKGFDYEATAEISSGFGLRNILNRLLILDGKIEIKSKYLEGTRLEICVPVKNDGQEN